MKIFLPILLIATGLAQANDRAVRWNSKFTETYASQAEGSRVTFSVRTPPQVNALKTYPLLIALSGGLRASPSEKFPFFQANPSRTRSWGFRSISTYDAMQVVKVMKERYPIDPNRVYLMGFSAGGSGAMHLASCYPDQFAAVLPLVAAGNNYPLANFRNLPVAFHHGDKDWTSAICNARVQANRMKALGCPVILKEYASGHSVPGSHEPLMQWLFDQTRNPAPPTIMHECEAPALGRSYWFKIREFKNPHRRAFVEATIKGRQVIVKATNIAAFSLTLKALPKVTAVVIGDQQLPMDENYQFKDGTWTVEKKLAERTTRLYEAGAAGNLYQGEPLLIVYGTAGDRAEHLKAAARKLAKYGGSTYATLPGAFPIVADTDLTAKQASNSNLLLVGTPAENSVTTSILPQLPIKIQNGVLAAGGRSKLPLRNKVLSFLHPHPEYPSRLVYVLAPFTNAEGLAQFSAAPQSFLAGPDGFDRISQADLLVQNTEHQIARQMQFGKDWRWIEYSNATKPIPKRYADREHLAVTCMQVMRTKSKADFALWWGPADKGMWGADFNDLENYDPEFYTAADFRTQNRGYETTLGGISGADLKVIWSRWGKNRELLFVPQFNADQIADENIYRVHIPMDLYIKLGQRKKNLIDPKAGPLIPAEEVRRQVFE